MTSTSSSMINGRKNNDNKNDDNKKKRDQKKKKKKKEKRRRGGSFLTPPPPPPPPITIAIMIVLCFVFVVIQNETLFIQIKEKKYNLRWKKIFKKRQYYRLWTSALMHNDIQHFVLNSIGTYYSGRQLENQFGSKYFMLITITSSIVTPLLYVSLAYLHDKYIIPMLASPSSHILEGTIGFSGILFSWTAIQCNYKQSSNPNKYSNVFGLMKVPPILYPWVLTVALAIIDYEESCWLHHISGILVGTLQYYYIEGCSKASSSIRSTPNNINETDVAATTGDDENSSTTINSNPDVKLDPQAMRKARLRKFD